MIGMSFRAVINTQNLNYTYEFYTPLGRAARFGRARMVQELIRRGAFINYADKLGDTPVYCAALGGHTDLVRHYYFILFFIIMTIVIRKTRHNFIMTVIYLLIN